MDFILFTITVACIGVVVAQQKHIEKIQNKLNVKEYGRYSSYTAVCKHCNKASELKVADDRATIH